MKRNSNASGFTLIEMLVVLGIIGILIGALMSGYKHVIANAQRARAVEMVSNVVTALTYMLQTKGVWPSDNGNALTTYANRDGNGAGCVYAVAKTFSDWGLMGVNLGGSDRHGLVDPWARDVMRKKTNVAATQLVPSGGTIRDHIIYYGLDTDLDGIVEAKVCGETVKVRASAIAWCAGADGKLGKSYRTRTKENADNVYSWRRNQEVKTK